MKKLVFFSIFAFACILVNCQNYYYVFFTDKNGVDFNPYQFFTQKAIDRRLKNNFDLYDKTDFPINPDYIKTISDFVEEFVGESRWFNMVMLSATDKNIAAVRNFPFVEKIVRISDNIEVVPTNYVGNNYSIIEEPINFKLTNQLINLQGKYFVNNNINGNGIRIAVFDGGFPSVDTHEAFEHLRQNGQIKKTYNFPLKKENVYGWNSHGTMVLSCIAGIKTGKDYSNKTESKEYEIKKIKLGLSTGAEFLLARTEVNAEYKKEEFWWLQAVEWADQNGADIINSSLGYGIQRYDYKDMDGKTSLVSQAARLAARKGILVCNSAGNEGNTDNWLGIITPADVDSVLTVGGIINSIDKIKRVNFSSYGPTADGKMKPNVVAFGHAEIASPKDDSKYTYVDGTSFSSPLVAGFAACALQTHPEWTGMQLKAEIEKSAHLYPYFDYSLGYGVPQASYFTEKNKPEIKPTFEIEEDSSDFRIKLLDYTKPSKEEQSLYFNIQDENGVLQYYHVVDIKGNINVITIKTDLKSKQSFNIFFDGYYQNYKPKNKKYYVDNGTISPVTVIPMSITNPVVVAQQKRSKWGYNSKHFLIPYVGFSMPLPLKKYTDFNIKFEKSFSINYGLRYKYGVAKWYGIGANFGFSNAVYRLFYFDSINNVTTNFVPVIIPTNHRNKYNKLYINTMDLEFYQRFRIIPTTLTDVHIDLGIFGAWEFSANYKQKWVTNISDVIQNTKIERIPLNYGVRMRIGYEFVELFAQYRISNYFENVQDLPKITVGVQIMLGCY